MRYVLVALGALLGFWLGWRDGFQQGAIAQADRTRDYLQERTR